jgi:hypothetical protein
LLCASVGASPGEGTGATMSDDEDNQVDSESNMFDGNDGSDGMGFGPLMLTEGERSLIERVRLELKHELKQVMLQPSKIFWCRIYCFLNKPLLSGL